LSMVIAVLYFLGIIIAEVFHDNPHAFPHLLVWMPNIVFIPLGAFLFWRLSRK
jgi:lipopolysaccharide export LptBFGC system permease protein LptF